MTENDIPLVSFFKRLLDPAIILGLLYLIIVIQNETFTGNYLALMIIAFFISSFIYEQIDLYRTLHVGNRLGFAADIFLGWGIIVAILTLIGEGTGLRYEFSDRVVWTWFALAPFVLLLSRLTAYRLAFNIGKDREVRTAVIVGSNGPGVDILRRLASATNVGIEMRGFFDDHVDRIQAHPRPYLGMIADVGAYVRAQKIK
ncbi:undecaprenyl-phosphate glucose phosphotransferase, partial [Glaciimonas immobilis]